jgi:hypothetical protein
MFNPFAMPGMPGMPPFPVGMMPFLPGQKVARRPNRPPPSEPQSTLYVRFDDDANIFSHLNFFNFQKPE